MGRYTCWTTGLEPVGTGYFDITDDGYHSPSGADGGFDGRWSYDDATRVLSFSSGPFAEAGWEGVYVPGTASDRRGTPTIVLRDRGDDRAPGDEGIGEFQYCYAGSEEPPDDRGSVAAGADAPPPGEYPCLVVPDLSSVGTGLILRADQTYTPHEGPFGGGGDGTWTFDAAEDTVRFDGGGYADQGLEGAYRPDGAAITGEPGPMVVLKTPDMPEPDDEGRLGYIYCQLGSTR